jgi:hypothetical protein
MPVHHEIHQADELAIAVEAESSAWRAVKNRLPGAPQFDPALWGRWLAAVQRCRSLRASAHAHPEATRPARNGTE